MPFEIPIIFFAVFYILTGSSLVIINIDYYYKDKKEVTAPLIIGRIIFYPFFLIGLMLYIVFSIALICPVLLFSQEDIFYYQANETLDYIKMQLTYRKWSD